MSENKEYVISLHPTARIEKQKKGRIKGMQETYYLVRVPGDLMYLGYGSTQAKAWKDAAETLKNKNE